MKVCSRCDKDYPSPLENYFSIKTKSSDGYQSSCKECHSKYLKRHYADNKKYYADKAHKRNSQMRIENLQKVVNYLKEHPCVDCGETDPIVLEFDHIRDKHKEISRLISDGVSFEMIQKEIEKCEVRCANCHRKRTAIQLGWYLDIVL